MPNNEYREDRGNSMKLQRAIDSSCEAIKKVTQCVVFKVNQLHPLESLNDYIMK